MILDDELWQPKARPSHSRTIDAHFVECATMSKKGGVLLTLYCKGDEQLIFVKQGMKCIGVVLLDGGRKHVLIPADNADEASGELEGMPTEDNIRYLSIVGQRIYERRRKEWAQDSDEQGFRKPRGQPLKDDSAEKPSA